MYPQMHACYIGKKIGNLVVGGFPLDPVFECEYVRKAWNGITEGQEDTPLYYVFLQERLEHSCESVVDNAYVAPRAPVHLTVEEDFALKGMEVQRLSVLEAKKRSEAGAYIIWRPNKDVGQEEYALEVIG